MRIVNLVITNLSDYDRVRLRYSCDIALNEHQQQFARYRSGDLTFEQYDTLQYQANWWSLVRHNVINYADR